MQGGSRIQGPPTAPAGGTIEVTLNDVSDTKLVVSGGGAGNVTRHKVGPNRKVTVQVPNTPGEILVITVEHRDGNFTTIYIPITSTSP